MLSVPVLSGLGITVRAHGRCAQPALLL